MTIEDLKEYGADVDTGLKRCVNNEGLYLKLVNKIPGDANFEKLYSAIEASDLDSAFEAAHAIKGASGNLSLSPIYDPIVEMTELLRARTDLDYSDFIEKIKSAHEALTQICDG